MMSLQRPDLSRAHILVVGDVMLDRYWFGEVSRISPEAPVPVARITRTEERPGGAANVARNAAAIGARVDLLAVVGADEAGEGLARLLEADGVGVQLTRDPTDQFARRITCHRGRCEVNAIDHRPPCLTASNKSKLATKS